MAVSGAIGIRAGCACGPRPRLGVSAGTGAVAESCAPHLPHERGKAGSTAGAQPSRTQRGTGSCRSGDSVVWISNELSVVGAGDGPKRSSADEGRHDK